MTEKRWRVWRFAAIMLCIVLFANVTSLSAEYSYGEAEEASLEYYSTSYNYNRGNQAGVGEMVGCAESEIPGDLCAALQSTSLGLDESRTTLSTAFTEVLDNLVDTLWHNAVSWSCRGITICACLANGIMPGLAIPQIVSGILSSMGTSHYYNASCDASEFTGLLSDIFGSTKIIWSTVFSFAVALAKFVGWFLANTVIRIVITSCLYVKSTSFAWLGVRVDDVTCLAMVALVGLVLLAVVIKVATLLLSKIKSTVGVLWSKVASIFGTSKATQMIKRAQRPTGDSGTAMAGKSVVFSLVGIHVLKTKSSSVVAVSGGAHVSPREATNSAEYNASSMSVDTVDVVGVYSFKYDPELVIFGQLRFTGVQKSYALHHWSLHQSTAPNRPAPPCIATSYLSLPPDIEQFRRLSKLPFLDIYGNVHQSYGSYLCDQVDFRFETPPAAVKTMRVPSAQQTVDLDVSNTSSTSASATPVHLLMCDEEHMCRLRAVGDSVEKIRDDGAADAALVASNTLLFTEMMKGEGYNNQSVKHLMDKSYGNPAQLEYLMEQLTPENDGTFVMFKSAFGWMSKIKAMLPKSITSSQGSVIADPDVSMSLNDFIGHTNIRLSAPVNYESLCSTAKAGDMIAVHGFQSLSSIICSVQSKIRGGRKFVSHVGMLIDTTVIYAPGMIEGEMYLLESCVGGGILGDVNDVVPDVFGLARNGVQLRSMRSLLRQSADQKTIYLHCPLGASARRQFDDCVGIDRTQSRKPCAIASCLERYSSKSYTTTLANFFIGVGSGTASSSGRRLVDILTQYSVRNSSPFGDEFFCSELVAALYVETGVLKSAYEGTFWGTRPETLSPNIVADLSSKFYFPRQVFPIDFFVRDSIIPYLFGDIRVVQPTE